ncbi:MAG: 1-acyl-sn-glycerol-3-phosphate acyltransferase [Paludibacteraceae bacterium]|nr:1-acyl-sn-glycerol-3-phosphate acyltransferase [Paludibacteraceae bacterium]
MARIQDKDQVYKAFRPLVDLMFRLSYRRYKIIGKEHIPTDGALIYAPNHTNALCDAMAILGITTGRKVFVARADIFKNPKAAWILNGLKIMPIRRMRDGIDEVRHNDETMQNAVDTLQAHVPFCILPEGTHRPMHSLLPLTKGIFRIALQANEQFGHERPVYILPVGLEYGDYFHLWDSLLINIGTPINVTEFAKQARADYLQAHGEEMTDPQLLLALREELTNRMKQLILYVKDDDNYEQNWQQLKANKPEPFAQMDRPNLSTKARYAFIILLAPLFVLSAIATLPLGLLTLLIKHKIKDPAFHNSVQYLLQFVLIPLSLFLAYPFWAFVQEYLYQMRHLNVD